jgi:CDP-diacylglycerol--glycerol-3-phosphate 3-phosphatidyltransferase
MRQLPNLLTGLRLVLALFTFFALAGVAGLSDMLPPETQFFYERLAFAAFVLAAITDFFDGWLARKLEATSLWGAILDPIADKVLVCTAVLGLMALHATGVVVPGALILFREFAVSALRETAASKGVRLPVTLLAKWKTTFQLLALGAMLMTACWAAFGLPSDPSVLGPADGGALALLWLATVITLITGVQYALQARRALAG